MNIYIKRMMMECIEIKLGKLLMDFCSRIQQLSLNKDLEEDSSSGVWPPFKWLLVYFVLLH